MPMTPMTLPHCKEVPVGGAPGPGDVIIDAPNPGPGTIVVSEPGGTPVHGTVPVPSGGPQTVHVPDRATAVLHYIAAKGGTPSVDVDVDAT